ncbi:MAG TPA: hypothetical protein ENI86_15750 [Acidimicrobiales bacterium]|nr:hypothetical protein [Acidimicrobiales bacterium]
MSDRDLTVVVLAHDRPRSLARLLDSLSRAGSDRRTPLVISVDPGGPNQADVTAVARRFSGWPGPTEVRIADRPLGLVGHFGRVGAMTSEIGPIVMLEDDLVVGPGFETWSRAALDAYGGSARVGGVSLNSLWFHGIRHLPFQPLVDGSDAFAVSVAWFHGVVMHPEWWASFERWRDTGMPVVRSNPGWELPAVFDRFGPDEWFPTMTRWLAQSGRTFVFPRWSHATNHGDAGTHFDRATDWFQTPVAEACSGPRLPEEGTWVGYDAWQEIQLGSLLRRSARVAELTGGDLTVDLWALRTRAEVRTEWILTTRPASRSAGSWGESMRPLEANVIHDCAGGSVHLSRTDDVDWSSRGLRHANRTLARHAGHGRSPSVREALGARLATSLGALRSAKSRPAKSRPAKGDRT